MNEILLILHLLLAVWLINKYAVLQLNGFPKIISFSFFIFKCVVGYCIYRLYHSGPELSDSEQYFRDADLLFRLLIHKATGLEMGLDHIGQAMAFKDIFRSPEFSQLPFLNDSYSVVVVNFFIRIFSFGVPAVHIIWMNMLAWIGICKIHNSLSQKLKIGYQMLLPYLFPQFIIWGSQILKEPLVILALGFLISGIYYCYVFKRKGLLNLMIGVIGFVFVKTYILIFILPASIAFLVWNYHRKLQVLSVFVGAYILVLLILLLLPFFSESLHLPSILYGQELNMYRFVVFNHAGSIIEPVTLAPTWNSFFKRIPESLLFSFTQPWPWRYQFRMALPVFIENVGVLMVIFIAFFRSGIKILANPIALVFIISGVSLLIVIGFTTPIAGNLVRYKMPGIFMILLSCCYIFLPSQFTDSKSTIYKV